MAYILFESECSYEKDYFYGVREAEGRSVSTKTDAKMLCPDAKRSNGDKYN